MRNEILKWAEAKRDESEIGKHYYQEFIDKINSIPVPDVEGYLEGKVTSPDGLFPNMVSKSDALAVLQSLASDKDEEWGNRLRIATEKYNHWYAEYCKEQSKVKQLQAEVERFRWIPVEERLPIENREGKQYSKRCFFTDGKNIHKGFFFPKKFKLCEWQDFDEEPDEYENYNVEEIDGELWLCEGWWNEYEHSDELYESYVHKVTHWIPLPESPKQ